MKAEGLTLNDFDFIVNSFQPTGVNGIPAMVDDAIGIPHDHSCKIDKCRDSTLPGHQTPLFQYILTGLGIRVIPESLHAVLQDIVCGNRRVQFQEFLQVRSFFLLEIPLPFVWFCCYLYLLFMVIDHVSNNSYTIATTWVMNHSIKGT